MSAEDRYRAGRRAGYTGDAYDPDLSTDPDYRRGLHDGRTEVADQELRAAHRDLPRRDRRV